MPRKNQAKTKRAANLKLARTAKASHRLSSRRARVKTPTRTSKVRPRGLAATKRGKKSARIQGILAHGSAERVVEGDNCREVGMLFWRSGLAGCSDGRCYDVAVGSSSRCARCQRSSHAYRPIPDHVKAAALKFFELHRDARASGTKEVCFLIFPAFLSLILT